MMAFWKLKRKRRKQLKARRLRKNQLRERLILKMNNDWRR